MGLFGERFFGREPAAEPEPTPQEQLNTVEEELDAVLTQIESAKKEAAAGGGNASDKAAVRRKLEQVEGTLEPKMEELDARRRQLREELGLPSEDTEEEPAKAA